MGILQKLTEMKNRLDIARPLSTEIVNALKEDFSLRYT